MQKYQNNVTNRDGSAAAGMAVVVNISGGAPATIYSDNGLTVVDNPMTTDVNGYFQFYAADGRYDIVVVGAGGYTDVLISDTVELSEDALRKEEAAATDGATKVGTPEGTVQDALDGRLTKVEAAATDGATKVGYLQVGTGAVADKTSRKLSERKTVQDFMTNAQRADCLLDNPELDYLSVLNNYADYLSTANLGVVDCFGNFRVSGKVGFLALKTPAIRFNAKIIADFSAEDEILLFKDSQFINTFGSLEVVGRGTGTYTSRTNGSGIRVNNCGRFTSSGILRVANTKYKGVQISNGSGDGGGNSSLWSLEKVRVTECGSGLAGTVRGVRQQIIGRVDSGTAGSAGQTTLLTLDAVPSGLEIFTKCKIGATLCTMTALPAGNTITVTPWPDLSISSGNIDFYIGGGLYTSGGDTSVGQIGTLDSTGCSVAYDALSLYPASIQNLVTQANGIGVSIGRGGNTSSVGGQIDLGYFENNDFDIVKATFAPVSFNLTNTLGPVDAKILTLAPRLGDNTLSASFKGMRGVTMRRAAVSYQPVNVLAPSARTLTFDQKPGFIDTVKSNGLTITLASGSENERIWNISDTAIMVAGTGANSRPTGTVTFAPPSGVAINGGAVDANAAFTGFTGPCLFYVRQESATAYTVQRCDFGFPTWEASKTYDPPSIAAGTWGASTTVTVTGAALGDYVSVSHSAGDAVLWVGSVSAVGTVTAAPFNPTASAIDLASGTLKARVIRA